MVRSAVARRKMGLALLAALLSTTPTLAHDDCAAPIQSLAHTVLEGREHLAPLPARRFGPRAIYLLMQYGDLPEGEAETLLAEAVAARIHGADDLDFAWRLHKHGLEATLAALGADALAAAVDTGRASSLRALITAGSADQVMAILATLSGAPLHDVGQLIVAVSFDLDDAEKAQLGAAAAAHGLDWLAAGFAAAQQDPAAWSDHVNGLSVHEIDSLASLWGWLPTYNGNQQVLQSSAERGEEADARREAMRLASWAAARQPEATIMTTYLSQTGDTARAGAVSMSLIKQFDTGSLAETGSLDQGWLATMEAFAATGLDANKVEAALSSVSWGSQRVGRKTVMDVLNWVVAVDALTPYLQGSGDLPAERPPLLSDAFADWDHWLALAEELHDDPATALGAPAEADLPILTELLLAAGKRAELAQVLDAAPVTLDTMTMANELAARLDRLCDARLWHKGEAPLLAGRALYKFDGAAD